VEEGKASITAIASAMLRAVHLLWDDAPKIFEDTFALRFSGCESEAALRAQFDYLVLCPINKLTEALELSENRVGAGGLSLIIPLL
jgi:hypothetical protein